MRHGLSYSFLVLLLTLACAAPAQAPGQDSGEAQPKAGGALAIAIGNEPFNFDITLVGRSGGNSESVLVAYDTLLSFKSGPP